MITLDEVRTALRITTKTLDGEIQSTMSAAVIDLKNAGVVEPQENNALINMAIILYARWQFNFLDRGPEYEKAYRELENSLALAYSEVGDG